MNAARLLSAVLLLLAPGTSARAADPWPAESNAEADDIGGELTGFEPSGTVWHPDLRQLFVVDDDGGLARLDIDGTNVTRWDGIGGDFEGVTYADATSDFVYVGQENYPTILEVDWHSGAVGRSWLLTEMATGDTNARLEALTFLPNAFCGNITEQGGGLYNGGDGSQYGASGLFLAGHQGDGKIYVYDVDLATTGVRTFVNSFGPYSDGSTLTDLSGLDFHRATGVLYAIWDGPNTIAALDVSVAGFQMIQAWSFPAGSDNEEGVTLIDDGCPEGLSRIAIAEDPENTHDVWVYEEFPVICPCPNAGASGNYCDADIYPNDGDGIWNYDEDGDCVIDMSDLGELLSHYGMTSGATREDGDVYPPEAGDGAVGTSDLGELLSQYGDDCN
jgi:hypothetical protein